MKKKFVLNNVAHLNVSNMSSNSKITFLEYCKIIKGGLKICLVTKIGYCINTLYVLNLLKHGFHIRATKSKFIFFITLSATAHCQ